MFRKKLYYALRPFVPQSIRFGIRRPLALWTRKGAGNVWPIKPGSERIPEDWAGWPEGKKFAFVLTHDVESQRGLDRVVQLAELEMEFGFRSKFNFIPEGPYAVSRALRDWLTERGFEVGVHDLHHDGRLYSSYGEFRRRATQINHYLAEWNATGFRSGFMLHRLDWLHALDISYDCSTFDTDPFEPQPDGCQTIFPFWVARPGAPPAGSANGRTGYVELPYTLPQDSTLFLLLREKTADIWKGKLDWITKNGGMALVNIHPDYIDFGAGKRNSTEYPVSRVRELLEYVSTKHANSFWTALPKNVASWYVRAHAEQHAVVRLSPSVPVGPPVGNVCERPLAGQRAVVLLYSYYPADPRPRRAAEALVAAGMTVELLCLRENDTEPKREEINGVNVWRIPMRRKRQSKLTYIAQYGRFLVSAFCFVGRRALIAPYAVVHVHNMPDVLVFAAIIPKLRGAAVILDLHDPMPELMMSIYELESDHWIVRVLKSLERWSLGFADLAFTPNLAFQHLFESRSCRPGKMHIVMNSPESEIFNPDCFSEPGAEARPTDSEFRIMHHGSIVHRHGVDLLVEAVARVRARIPGLRLDIYGSRTAFLDEVLGVARRLGVADIVHFHGAKPQSEIARAIRESHVGVVPNRQSPFTELNFPTRLFEYLAMHRPVIAPATKGIKDYFGPEELVMFEAGDVEDLASKILWVHSQPELAGQFVERGRQVYRRNLWSAEKARFVDRVNALLAEKGWGRHRAGDNEPRSSVPLARSSQPVAAVESIVEP